MKTTRAVVPILVGLMTVSGCQEKTRKFFEPVGIDLLGDETPPFFIDPQPPNTVDVFSGRGGAMVTVEDAGSGVDPSSVTATLPDGTSLPVTTQPMSPNQSMITIDLSGLTPETTAKIGVRAEDNAGNEGQTSFDFFFDPLPPRIDVGFPAAEIESSEETFTFTLPIEVEDPTFSMTTGRLFDAGADGACGGGDDELLDEVHTLLPTLDLGFGVSNPVATGEDPRTVSYCFEVEARDGAQGKTGDPDRNVAIVTSLTNFNWSSPLVLTTPFLGIPDGSGDLPPGTYEVDVREGAEGPVVGRVTEEFRETGNFPLLFRNPTHLAMTDVARVVELDSFTLLSGGGSLAPAQASPLVGFDQYGWCSEQDLLQFTPAIVRMRDANGTLVHQTTLSSLPDNAPGTTDPLCGFVVVPEPDRVVEIELDTFRTHVRLIGACQRNAPANDLQGRCGS